jgi:hypothetical protein
MKQHTASPKQCQNFTSEGRTKPENAEMEKGKRSHQEPDVDPAEGERRLDEELIRREEGRRIRRREQDTTCVCGDSGMLGVSQ